MDGRCGGSVGSAVEIRVVCHITSGRHFEYGSVFIAAVTSLHQKTSRKNETTEQEAKDAALSILKKELSGKDVALRSVNGRKERRLFK